MVHIIGIWIKPVLIIICWSRGIWMLLLLLIHPSLLPRTFCCTVCASFANALFCILHPSVHLAHNVFVRHGGPRARPGWTPTIRLSFHYFVIGIQRPPTHAINPVPSPYLHHFVCKLSLVCPCYFLPKSSVSSPKGPLFFPLDFCICCCNWFIYLLGFSFSIQQFSEVLVTWINVVTGKKKMCPAIFGQSLKTFF